MEALYEVTVEIGGHHRDREQEMIRGCMVEWGFRKSDFERVPGTGRSACLVTASALSSVSEGEEIVEIIGRIERAVWRANGGICHVDVTARCVRPSQRQDQVLADMQEAGV